MKYINKQHKYNNLSDHLKEKYKSKVFKVSLNGNFTCPNRDGTISKDGCIFCSSKGSGDFAGNPQNSLSIQFEEVKRVINCKWPKAFYIVYFQANTNTYKPIEELKKLYEEAITLDKDIVAISIATRPDCLPLDVLDYLEILNKKIPVWVELGLQTIKQETISLINRGYENERFTNSCAELRKRGIEVIVHIINGLPNETKEDMYKTIHFLNKHDINGIKIHSLYVLENTKLSYLYKNNYYKELSYIDYIEVTANQIALLNENIIIHRINGDPPKELLISPSWSLKKFVIMNDIDKYMKLHNLYQGKKKES